MNLVPQLTPSNLQIVTMDAPYYTLRNSSLAREIFGKMLGTRLNAYLKDYGESVFPLGKEDFLSELVIICVKDKNELIPVYSYKITTLETCERHNIPFPLIGMLRNRYQDQVILKTVENFILKKTKTKTKLAYFGSRSKSVELNWSKESSGLLYHVGICALVNACKTFNVEEFVLFAMLNNQAYKYCEMLGMEKVLENPTIVDSLAEAPGYVMHKKTFSDEALDIASKFQSYWRDRIHIARDANELSQTA